jgi:cysteinyl-tRNA synthetase
VYEALRLLRDKLSLVGFSDATVRAGLEQAVSGQSTNIVGGERALAEQLVQFRTAVRKYALDDIRNEISTPNTKEILRLCDEARDDILPSIGLELNDDKIEHASDEVMVESSWRFCVPRVRAPSDNAKASTVAVPSIPLDTPVEDLFRFGQYKNQFSEYDTDGIPTHTSDGSEISKSLRKKLLQKREKYQQKSSKLENV